MQEFAYIIVFKAYQNNGNHCETTKKSYAHFQEHNLKKNKKISLHHAISIISMASKMTEAD